MLTFLGIGAQKAGTTWLYAQLNKHPQISFPGGKEIHFWDRLDDPKRISAYLARFGDTHRYQGEITPAYALLPVAVITHIQRVAPDVKLFYLLRNPIERAWSSALMALGRAEMTFEEASDAWFIDHFRSSGSLRRGDYATCIRNWHQIFPTEQLLLLRHEAIQTRPEELLRQCYRHIGVAAPATDLLADCRERVFAGPGHSLRPNLRAALVELYRPRVAALEDLLGEDFSAWLRGPAETCGIRRTD